MFSLDEIRQHEDRLLESYQNSPFFQNYDFDRKPLTEDAKRQLVKLLETTKKFISDPVRLNEYTTTSMIHPNRTYTLPMIRRIYPNLFAQDLVSVQVTPVPTATVFFKDFYYDTDVAPTARGTRMDPTDRQQVNDARFYSAGFVRGEVIGVGDGIRTEFAVRRHHTPYHETKFTPIHPNANLQVFVDSVPQVIKFSGTPQAGEVLVIYQTGDFVFGTAPASGAAITANYDLRMEGDDSRIPELTLAIRSMTTTTSRRKLKARWTLEAEQDLMAYYGTSLESELTAAASEEIQREIDREIMFDLLGAATENVNWVGTWPGATSGYSRLEYDETLLHALNEASARIFRKRRVQPNWIVAGADVAVRLQNMSGFSYSGDLQRGVMQTGTRLAGTVQNRWNLYVDPYFPDNTLLMGYKGSSLMDAGYIYTPYVGLIATDTIMDPNDFTPRKGWMRRDGKVLVSGDFYATVTVV